VLILVSTALSCCLAPKTGESYLPYAVMRQRGEGPWTFPQHFELPACATPSSIDTQPYMRGALNSGMAF
jgi:hypothetical protein